MVRRWTCHRVLLVVVIVSFFYGGISADDQRESIEGGSLRQLKSVDDSPLEGGEEENDNEVLSRHRRSTNQTESDKSIWQEIEDFYSNKNNMAMYCVLPIMVLIYGGCSAIYCIHKCRQYIRRRKHKRLKEEDVDSLNSDKNDLNQEVKASNHDVDNRPISQISQAWTDLGDNTDNDPWSGTTSVTNTSSPLPWQVVDKPVAAAALAHTHERQRTNISRASYLSDRLQEDISLQSTSKNQGIESRSSSRASVLEDRLMQEEFKEDARKSHSENLKIVAGATAASSAAASFGESTDDQPSHHHQQQQQQQHRRNPAQQVTEESRTAANLNDYATNRSSKTKATDYSRFTDSKPIEIVPLSADPSLRVWDPLHKRPWGEMAESSNAPKIEPIGEAAGRKGAGNIQAMKEEMLARYDALSTFQMAKKAAEILKTNAVEKSPFQRKPNKKKHIFIAE